MFTRSVLSRSARGVVAILAAAVLWGTGGLLGSLLGAATGLGALAVATVRLGGGGLLVLAWLAARRTPIPRSRAAWSRVLVIAALSTLYQAGYFIAISLTSVSLATFVNIGAVPVLVLAVERLTGCRRLDGTNVVAVVLALAGLGLLIGVPGPGQDLTHTLLGAGVAVLSAAGFAATTLVGARPIEGLDPLSTTGYAFLLGALALAPVAAIVDGLGLPTTIGSLALAIALALGPTALAYSLYFGSLHHIDPTTVGVLTIVEPLTSTLLAAALLDDRLGPAGLVGAALLGVAVVLVTARPPHRRAGAARWTSGRVAGRAGSDGNPGRRCSRGELE